MDAETDFSDIDKIRVSVRDGGKTVMTFGLGLSLVLRQGEAPAKRAALLDVMEAYTAWAGGRVTHYLRPTAKRASRLGPGGVREAYGPVLATADPARDDFVPVLMDKELVSNIGFFALMTRGAAAVRYPNSLVFGRFPAATARTDADALIGMVLDWCNRLRPMQGTLGLAPLFEAGMDRTYPSVLWPYLSRFVGLDYTWTYTMALGHAQRIKGVNWLTILEDALVAELGGPDHLAEALGSAATILPWDGGILIRAGAAPQLGDRDAGLWPEAYVAVNRALRPIRYEDHPARRFALIDVPAPLDPLDETLNWVRRFDRDDPPSVA
jgi:hypothetical protein